MILDIDEVDATDLELLDRYSIPDLCSRDVSDAYWGPEPPLPRAPVLRRPRSWARWALPGRTGLGSPRRRAGRSASGSWWLGRLRPHLRDLPDASSGRCLQLDCELGMEFAEGGEWGCELQHAEWDEPKHRAGSDAWSQS